MSQVFNHLNFKMLDETLPYSLPGINLSNSVYCENDLLEKFKTECKNRVNKKAATLLNVLVHPNYHPFKYMWGRAIQLSQDIE